jgi:5-(carboxyamino)imidazole ribonucleotide synthase
VSRKVKIVKTLKSKTSLPAPAKVGILGGGQLARMLAIEGPNAGCEVHILCPNPDDPAALICNNLNIFWHKGDPKNKSNLLSFAKKMDHLTFESEFFDLSCLAKPTKDKSIHTQISPSIKAMGLMQNRKTQKEQLLKYKVPTSRFFYIEKLLDQKKFLQLLKKLNGQAVLKKTMGGYDGNGTFLIRDESEALKIFANLKKNNPKQSFILEEFIPFNRELAIICARSQNGDFVALPLVETYQVENRCDWVAGPIEHPDYKKTVNKIKFFLKKINYIGTIGFELFELRKNQKRSLLVNEVAPRVHNSGHYSQDALFESQFLIHLKAILGQDLNQPKLKAHYFCMLNLIGNSSKPASVKKIFAKTKITGQVHWYDKKQIRPGRKIGHINYLSPSDKKNQKLSSLLFKALHERTKLKL